MSTAVHSDAESPLADPDTRETLRALPPSAKLVALVLEHSDPLTINDLADQTLLPGRTVRYALTRLEEATLVQSQPSVRNPRKQVYSFA